MGGILILDSKRKVGGLVYSSGLARRGSWPDAPLGGGDEDSCTSAGVGLWSDDDFDVSIEGSEKIHEALNGEAIQAIMRQRGNFRLVDFEPAGCGQLR